MNTPLSEIDELTPFEKLLEDLLLFKLAEIQQPIIYLQLLLKAKLHGVTDKDRDRALEEAFHAENIRLR